jgi:hypothetical protein
MRKHKPRWLHTAYAPIEPESSLPGSPFTLGTSVESSDNNDGEDDSRNIMIQPHHIMHSVNRFGRLADVVVQIRWHCRQKSIYVSDIHQSQLSYARNPGSSPMSWKPDKFWLILNAVVNEQLTWSPLLKNVSNRALRTQGQNKSEKKVQLIIDAPERLFASRHLHQTRHIMRDVETILPR